MPYESIDLENDQLLTMAQACRLLPRRPSPSTIWRWRVRGVGGVRLKCVRVGGMWATTARALAEFLRAQTDRALPLEGDAPPSRPDSTTRRLRDAGLLE